MASGQTIILSSQYNRLRAKRLIEVAPQNAVVNVREAKRTNAQNDLMWALISQICRAKPQGRVLSPDAWKALFMASAGFQCQFEPGLDGQGVVPLGFKSSRLNKADFSELLEAIYSYAAEHGVQWTDPETRRAHAAKETT